LLESARGVLEAHDAIKRAGRKIIIGEYEAKRRALVAYLEAALPELATMELTFSRFGGGTFASLINEFISAYSVASRKIGEYHLSLPAFPYAVQAVLNAEEAARIAEYQAEREGRLASLRRV